MIKQTIQPLNLKQLKAIETIKLISIHKFRIIMTIIGDIKYADYSDIRIADKEDSGNSDISNPDKSDKTPKTARASHVQTTESRHVSADISDVVFRTIVTKICLLFSCVIKLRNCRHQWRIPSILIKFELVPLTVSAVHEKPYLKTWERGKCCLQQANLLARKVRLAS